MNPYTHTNRYASIVLSTIGTEYVVSVFLLNDAGQPDYADGELFVRDYQSTESAAALAAFERCGICRRVGMRRRRRRGVQREGHHPHPPCPIRPAHRVWPAGARLSNGAGEADLQAVQEGKERKAMNWKAGDEAILVGVNMVDTRRVTVQKVGRKYVTVDDDLKFDAKTGEYAVQDYASHYHLYTPQQWERVQLEKRLRNAFQRQGGYSRFTDEQILRLLEILEPG